MHGFVFNANFIGFQSSTINCKLSHFREFGKGVLKVYGTHPDAFVQAAIQLTYHRMHGKPGSAYETATTRQFYHGRTETCRTCTLETVDFAKAMDDVDTEETTKWNLLKKSLDKHQQLMRKAQGNMGCDRHMFGMQMIAKENGMFDQLVGEVFGPGAWTKSGGDGQFKLSTSLLGYTPMTGGMVAMCAEGYGVFYSIEDDCINYAVSNWVGAGTDHEEFSRVFEDSLLDMERLAACNYSAPL
ncbi:unnamed protein product [Notodromas monacha]|uniref:Choline/carnitine acyltransferase domain-containing protein n=1 Tax=Notodromas monacha TaxID=399045 RepID=A0A7R9BNJ3_9CRUS|nr:unnamed protein product [Notodromas monacha]CAG0917259.1 unnamed protein product [Notodromas monacha]